MAAGTPRTIRLLVGMPFGWVHGGAERLLDDFLRHAPEVAIEPRVVFLKDGDWPADLRARGIEATVVDPGRFRQLHRNLAAVEALRRNIRGEPPDVVLSWFSRAHVLLAPAAIAAGLRQRLMWFQHQIKPLAVERAATMLPSELILACSASAARAQEELWPHRRVHVANPGIEPPVLVGAEDLSSLRAELGVPSGAAVVGISGRLVRWKNHGALLRAVGEVTRRGRDVHLLVVGSEGNGLDPGYGGELKALAGALDLEDRVTFTGFRSDAVALTQLMDIAVNASEEEPFGISVVEALAVGVPVVAVASGGPAEIVDHGRTGILVPGPIPALLADALVELIDNPGRRIAFGNNGREAMQTRYTIKRFTGVIRAALDEVIASAGRS